MRLTTTLQLCYLGRPLLTRFSGHSALRHTTSLRFSDPPPCPPSLFSCTSPSWSVWPLTGLVVLCLGFEPGRHSSVGNTLTIQRFLLSGNMIRLVGLYIVTVWLMRAKFCCSSKGRFSWPKKLFFLKVCAALMQGRKRANYAGKWSIHGAKWSDTTGQCIYDVKRAYTM